MSTPRFHEKDLRKGRTSIPGQIYHLTFVTHARTPIFQDLYSGRRVINILREIRRHKLADTLAFVIMPDHMHWLMRLGSARDLSGTVGTLKSLTARRLGANKLWLPGFHDHAVRSEEDVVAIARYIVANPLRANLVEHIGAYSLWDAIWL